MNRLKNAFILIVLISFLCFIAIMPVTCIIKSVTGIYCPACGMTRSFLAIMHFDFLEALHQNILGIPFFIFICFFIIMIIKDIFQNRFSFIPNLLNFLGRYAILIIVLLAISMLFNNLKVMF